MKSSPLQSPFPRQADEARRLERALERFNAVLVARSLKMSKVREAIAKTALGYPGHFAADDLARLLQQRGVRDAHLATVYRAIPLLIEAGLIQPVLGSKPGAQRYEAAFEREHHHRLVCRSCGKVIAYRSLALEALRREIAQHHGFVLEEHVLELLGRCRACRSGASPAH